MFSVIKSKGVREDNEVREEKESSDTLWCVCSEIILDIW